MILQELKSASDEKLRAMLEHADPMVLRAVVYHATGDEAVVNIKTTRVPGLFMDAAWVEDPESLSTLREKGFALLKAYRDGNREPPMTHDCARTLKAMSLAVDEPVPPGEYEYWFEELGIDPSLRQHRWIREPEPSELRSFKVLVIGAGLGGLNAGIQLQKAGFDFLIVDKNAGVGGTWYQNRYPGARVDLPSRIYSHSLAMDYQFEHLFAPQEENNRYVNWLADRFDLRKSIRLRTEVLSLCWIESASQWQARIKNADGSEETLKVNAVISAVGFLDRPVLPDIPGIADFAGRIFHTSTFDPSIDLSDQRVGIVGTGASGMQMMPDLLTQVAHLTVFQRSPGWVVPIPGYREPYSEEVRWLLRNVPFYGNWTRHIMAWAIGDHVIYDIWTVDPSWKDPHTLNKDNFKLRERLVAYLMKKIGHRPDLVAKCLPDYPPLSKRYVVDNGWFDALLRDNVELIANDPIDRFTKDGIVTRAGKTVPLDVVVLATGFHANEYFWPMKVRGRGGVTVDEVWAKDGARAFWGINVLKLPNLFCIYGPNTNPKNTGPVPYGESQVRYILKCLEAMVVNGWKSLEVKPEVYDEHNRVVDARNASSIFLDKRQKSYYTNQFGRSAVASPWSTLEYWRKLRNPDFTEYLIDANTPDTTVEHAGDPPRSGVKCKTA
jgi:4-hydroxyacetophenone monooxygenase